MNKIKVNCNIAFNYIFVMLFGLITISAITVICKNIFVIISTALMLFTLIGIGSYFYTNKKMPSEKQINIAVAVIMIIMFILQLTAGFFLISKPITDWGVIDKIAHNYAESGNFDNMYDGLKKSSVGYMARYPNNNGILILLSLFYRCLYLICGNVPEYAPVILNTIFIFVAVIFTFLIAKKIFNPFGALITVIFCFLFLPYYTYTAYYYSDSLSIPFTTMSIYFCILSVKQPKEKHLKRIIYLVVSALCISVGYTLKGSLLVILVGVIVYLALSNKLKYACISIISIVLAFCVFTMSINTFVKSFNFTTEEELYEQRYPINHWIMMGLHGNGGYYNDDAVFTRHAGNYDQKKKAANAKIAERLNDMGFYGMTNHLYKKLSFTWGDGTYWISHHLNTKDENGNDVNTNRNSMFEFVLKDGRYHGAFYIYSNAMHLSILILMVASAYYATRRKRITTMTLIRGIIFGVAIFFMFWEARSRYLFNFTPLFILAAVSGLTTILSRTKLYARRHLESKRQLQEEFDFKDNII